MLPQRSLLLQSWVQFVDVSVETAETNFGKNGFGRPEITEEGFMAYTAAHHQEAKTFRPHFEGIHVVHLI